ncbi:MAG: RsmE family RNA methyltransferase [Candidatus Omnitrophota bacterium]
MNRFFVEKRNIGKEAIKITDNDDVRHLVSVLRLCPGEDVFISDGEGGGYITKIEKIDKNSVVLKIKDAQKRRQKSESKIIVTLACAIPKNARFARFEDIIDKAAQLGVSEIIPLLTERTLIESGTFDKRRERFKRIIIAAASQSGVLFLPELRETTPFEDLISRLGQYELRLLPNLSDRSHTLREVVSGFTGKKILVLIGPEGDFTKHEIEAALSLGCVGVSLGDSVLRVDTAAISVVSFLRLYFGG